jgi:glycerol-3-phosphate dehydrogenase (NAD(P)+)
MRPDKIAIIGAGSWGTALAHLLGSKGLPVTLLAWDEPAAEYIRARRRNPQYLQEVQLPDCVGATADLAEALADAPICIIALPCAVVAEVMSKAAEYVSPDAIILSASKGLDPQTGSVMSEVVARSVPQVGAERLVVLSGPNLALEMVRQVPTATVVASASPEAVKEIQRTLGHPCFRVYGSADVVGVQLGGALKNVYAIGAGVGDGLGFGQNTKASLVTRGLAEMIRIGTSAGADARTFSGLSGIGDLVATCASSQSRNWTVGYRLARGEPLPHILATVGMVAEGVPTAPVALALAQRLGVEAPIIREVHQVLYERKDPARAVADLMTRELGPEY